MSFLLEETRVPSKNLQTEEETGKSQSFNLQNLQTDCQHAIVTSAVPLRQHID